ncbi:MAG: cation:proton antiporter [Deltaproteobacteria bacterium]|nr:cation:proton antiporter [Deltaproteobacteria bacterium]MBI3296008.1 cation:proton antiporter [Deltaproteobacteria bacterium]
MNHLLHTLLALASVIVTARAVGSIFKFLGQPPVIGEVIGGILLGPTFLGRHLPEASAFLFPLSTLPFLAVIAQLGVIFYMFVVGLELDLKLLRKSGHATLAISHGSILFPFLLGAYFALKHYSVLSAPDVPFTNFALFLGVSMSVTAFPVLARILTDRKIHRSRMGTVALTCAAIDDVTAWCLLAVVVSIVHSKLGGAVWTIVLTFAYIAAMFFIGGPLIRRLVPWLEKFDQMTEGGIAIFFVGLLLSALATEAIGIHAIFGAFLLGAVTPHDSRVAKELTNRIEDLVRIMFLPAFFAYTGMRTQIGLLTTSADWELCGLIILVATVGKFGGTFVSALFSGLNWRDSAALGVLMNTRGLVELIVLNIGLDMHVITPRLFAMLVMMALVTTFMTTPLLHLLTRNHPWAQEDAH